MESDSLLYHHDNDGDVVYYIVTSNHRTILPIKKYICDIRYQKMARTKQGPRVVLQVSCSRQMMATRAAGRSRCGNTGVKRIPKRSISKKVLGSSMEDLQQHLSDILAVYAQ